MPARFRKNEARVSGTRVVSGGKAQPDAMVKKPALFFGLYITSRITTALVQ